MEETGHHRPESSDTTSMNRRLVTKIESSRTAGSSLLHFRKISAQSDDATAFEVH